MVRYVPAEKDECVAFSSSGSGGGGASQSTHMSDCMPGRVEKVEAAVAEEIEGSESTDFQIAAVLFMIIE